MKQSTPEQPKAPSPLKVLLMGPGGTFKTTLLLQVPGIHMLDCDNNLDGPEKHIREVMKLPVSYTYDLIRFKEDGTPEDVTECYNKVCDILRRFRSDEKYKARKAVGLDSLSHVNEFIIRHVLKLQGKERKTLEMERRDWDPFKSYAHILLMGLLEGTGKTMFVTCHVKDIIESDGQIQKIVAHRPSFQGETGRQMNTYFTDVWFMETRLGPGGKVQSWLKAQATPKLELKNSVGLPAELELKEGFKTLEPYLKGRI